MTVKELKEILEKSNDDAEICFGEVDGVMTNETAVKINGFMILNYNNYNQVILTDK
jgi:hypothetical protein